MTTDSLKSQQTFRVGMADLNGQARGKRVPGDYAGKLAKGAVRMPFSAVNVDIAGADIAASPLVFESGDADAVLAPTGRGPVPMPWLPGAPYLVPMWMFDEAGAPFAPDPRQALHRVLERFHRRGWQVIAATELEFTLVDDSGAALAPPRDPLSDRPLAQEAVYGLRELDAFDPFLNDLYNGAAAMGIPAQATISEAGIGQFETNLLHQDAMRAADDTWLFKMLVRGLARKHRLAATFMAKPYAGDAGNGLHVHFSVLDAEGANIFDDDGPRGSEILLQAVAGCLAAMPASTLIFAPHGNSYDRLVPGAHAPTGASWGYENRTAAIRIPGGAPAGRRIEHWVAGGDTNPYLMLAAVLGAAYHGIENAMTPDAPVTGNAYEQPSPQLAPGWAEAVAALESSAPMADILGPDLIDALVRCKRQEIRKFAGTPPETAWKIWLETV